jgi:hypothetical protein
LPSLWLLTGFSFDLCSTEAFCHPSLSRQVILLTHLSGVQTADIAAHNRWR